MMKIGTRVTKKKGYAFDGVVVAIFENTIGQVRIVAEHLGSQTKDSGGMLHIFSEAQLTEIKYL